MKTFTSFLIVFLFLISSCTDSCETCEERIDELEAQMDELTHHSEGMDENGEETNSEDSTKVLTTDDAMEFLIDYYDFYKPDLKYRNERIRQISSEIFQISIEERDKSAGSSSWEHKILRLRIFEDQTYEIEEEEH